MAGKLLSMDKVIQILRQYHGLHYSKRQVSSNLKMSRNTLDQYLDKFSTLDKSIEIMLNMDNIDLERYLRDRLNPENISKQYDAQYKYLFSQFKTFRSDLKDPGVTRQILWEDYVARCQSFKQPYYSYSQFCYHYQYWRKSFSSSMHMDHEPGEELYVDFTGNKLRYFCLEREVDIELEVLVCTFGFSCFTYVEAIPSQRSEDFISGIINSLEYFNGTPRVIVPDNLKSAVTNVKKLELSEKFYSMCNHYGMSAAPTRGYHPQDKSLVEKHVAFVYSQIFAPLRNKTFTSMHDVNIAVWELLDKMNKKKFQQLNESREDLFKEESLLLGVLPPTRYECYRIYKLKVNKQYHVFLSIDKHHYSVPYKYIDKTIKAMVSSNRVSLHYGGREISSHVRNRTPRKFSTHLYHMPPDHKHIKMWDIEAEYDKAKAISSNTHLFLKEILAQVNYKHQQYRVCQVVHRIIKNYGENRFKLAIDILVQYSGYELKNLYNILDNNVENLPIKGINSNNERGQDADVEIDTHSHARGQNSYN